MKELSSADTTSHAGAVERADSWLEASKRKERQTGGVNRTVINSNSSAAEVPAAGTVTYGFVLLTTGDLSTIPSCLCHFVKVRVLF